MTGVSEPPRELPGVDGTRPTFRYTLPATPAAAAGVDIDHVSIKVELYLHGELATTVTTRRPSADPRTVRACTLRALRVTARGLMVSGISSYAPTIVAAAGHRFTQAGYQFRAPNTMAFVGACEIGFVQPSDCGSVQVGGQARYTLDVTATPVGRRGLEPAPAQPGAWFLRHEQELASIGVVVLAAVPIAPGRLVASDRP